MLDTITQQTQTEPKEDWRKLNRVMVEREAARLLEQQFAGEQEAWDVAKAEDFIAKTVRLVDSTTDIRAKARFAEIVSSWLRLGKREAAATQAQSIGTQINIQIVAPTAEQAREAIARDFVDLTPVESISPEGGKAAESG